MRARRNHINMTVIILILVFCMAVLGGTGYFIYTNKAVEVQLPRLEPEIRAQGGTLHNPVGRQTGLDDMVWERILTLSINAIPVMEDGRVETNLLIENPPDNGNWFTISIGWGDTGEELYQSGYLDPRQYVESTPLDRELPVGEYPCLVYIDTYRISDSAHIGETAARITLFIQG